MQASSSHTHLNTLEFNVFIKQFEHIFDWPNYSGCASNHLFMIQEGSRSVTEYAIEFGTLAEEATWNEPALLNVFRQGLRGWVSDALVGGPQPKDLVELIDHTIEIDNHQLERRREFLYHLYCPVSPRSPASWQVSPSRSQSRSPLAAPRSLGEEPNAAGSRTLDCRGETQTPQRGGLSVMRSGG